MIKPDQHIIASMYAVTWSAKIMAGDVCLRYDIVPVNSDNHKDFETSIGKAMAVIHQHIKDNPIESAEPKSITHIDVTRVCSYVWDDGKEARAIEDMWYVTVYGE
jgi:hypothetical protein